MCAAPIARLRADRKTDPPLTLVGWPRLTFGDDMPRLPDRLVDQVDVVDVFFDQCIGTVGEFYLVTLLRERLERGPLDAPHPPILPLSGPRANTAVLG